MIPLYQVIVRPISNNDVSVALAVASKFRLQVSVRSGGHGYVCNNIKHNGMHIDLRKMNKIELQEPSYKDVGLI